MTTILIVPNAFKGTLSSSFIADIIEKSILSVNSYVKIIKSPIADGGDGTIDTIYNSIGGEIQTVIIHDPLFRKITSSWLKLGNEKSTAVIEAAKANGLSLLKPEEYNPYSTTTYGVGELIIDSVKHGCKEILLCIGGSATNDAGYGALKALGVKFLDKNRREIEDNVKCFKNIENIDVAGVNSKIQNIKFRVATDVTNPLLGINGASYVYARQKGATKEDLSCLDESLRYFADKCYESFGVDNRNILGSGAAGGIGYGLSEVFDVEFTGGFDEVADIIKLEEKIKCADIIITGEGKLDNQSAWGKAPIKVAELAAKYGKRCIAIVGINEQFNNDNMYFEQIISIVNKDISIDKALKFPAEMLELALMANIDKILKI